MPLQEAVTAPTIENLPAPAGGLEFDIAKVNPDEFRIALTGAVTAGAGKGRYTNTHDYPVRLREVNLHAGTAPTGADLIVDVNVEGSTAFSAQTGRPKIVAGQTRGSAVPARTGDPVNVQPGETVTVDVDQVGSTVAGSDLDIVVELVKIAENDRSGELY